MTPLYRQATHEQLDIIKMNCYTQHMEAPYTWRRLLFCFVALPIIGECLGGHFAGSVVSDEKGFDPSGAFSAPAMEDDPCPGKFPLPHAGDRTRGVPRLLRPAQLLRLPSVRTH